MSAGGGARAIIAAFFANLGIAIAKFVGFVITGSSSMLAESIHSVADTGNQGLLLLGRRRATRAADEEHNFGYGRERFFWAFVVALVLFSLGSLFSLYEAAHKIQHPEEITSPMVAIVILVVAIGLELWSFRTAYHEARAMKGDESIVRFIRRTRVPELPVVLLEDLGALIGLFIATGALLMAWKVDPIWDGYGTLVIGVLLGLIAVVLAIEMKSLLIGEAATPEDLAAIRQAIEQRPSVERIIHLRTEHVAPEEVLLATKLAFAPQMDMAALAASIDEVEAAVRDAVPTVKLIFIEPDLDRTPAR
ncbi:MAG TPA: cation diffusion facilitator family transporter [Microthrixaceae bacterium]|nr:cation diffusion facilitator family transporter [Microthrixaceae bacterium]